MPDARSVPATPGAACAGTWVANPRGPPSRARKLGRIHAMGLALVQSRALLGPQRRRRHRRGCIWPMACPALRWSGPNDRGQEGPASADALNAAERGTGVPQQQRRSPSTWRRPTCQDSGRFDLPIALGILAANGQVMRRAWPAGDLPASTVAVRASCAGARRADPTWPCMAWSRLCAWCCRRAAPENRPGAQRADLAHATCWTWCGGSAPPATIPSQSPTTTAGSACSQAPPASGRTADLADVRGQAAAKRAGDRRRRQALLLVGPPRLGQVHASAALARPAAAHERATGAANAAIAQPGRAFTGARWMQRITASHPTAAARCPGRRRLAQAGRDLAGA